MQVFSELVKNIESVQKNLPSIVASVMEKNSDQMIDLNVGQLRKGLTSEGKLIQPGYASDEYAQLKKAMGSKAPQGTPDLILEGDFTGAFYTKKVGDGILFDSNDEKTNELDNKYENIFGLTKESKTDLNETAIPEILNIIENEIFK